MIAGPLSIGNPRRPLWLRSGISQIGSRNPRKGLVRWRRYAPAAWFYVCLSIVWIGLQWLARPGHMPGVAWWVWVAVALGVNLGVTIQFTTALRLSDRFPLTRGVTHVGVTLHAIAALGTSALLRVSPLVAIRFSPIPLPKQGGSFWVMFVGDAVIYVVLVGTCQALRRMRSSLPAETSRRRLDAAVLDVGRRRMESDLRALKTELNSHFLGDTLGAVRSLMHHDVAAADRVLARLGDILRRSIVQARTNELTLREELHSLEPLLEIERVRLRDHLTVDVDVSDEIMSALVPDMLLQPLLADATKQVSALGDDRCRIRISGERLGKRGERIQIRVSTERHGVGCTPASDDDHDAVAIAKLRERLSELYRGKARIDVGRSSAPIHDVRVTLPWRTEEDDEPLPAGDPTRSVRGRGWSAARIALAVASFWGWMWLWNVLVCRGGICPAEYGGLTDRQMYAGRLAMSSLALFASLAAFWLTREYPWAHDPINDKDGGWRAVAVHGLAGVFFGIVLSAEKFALTTAFGLSLAGRMTSVWPGVSRTVLSMTMLMFVFSGFAHAIEGFKRQRTTDGAVPRLEAALDCARRRRTEAELRALKAELNPHFVGNALAAVSALMRTDVAAAERMLTHVAELLRTAQARTGMQEVTLREELDTLRPFLAVEQARLGRELEMRVTVDDGAMAARVPHMILQPLIENATKHGLAFRQGSGRIGVAARRGNGQLELIVRDDGIGLGDRGPVGAASRTGVGLTNTHARLSELYGDKARLELSAAVDGGTIARLTIPWRETPAQA